jgi:hypothetical protein
MFCRKSSLILENGHLYQGSVSRAQLPHGFGTEFVGKKSNKLLQELFKGFFCRP